MSEDDGGIDKLINEKEEEIKKMLGSKIVQLNKTVNEKDSIIRIMQEELKKLKDDFAFNYNLIVERDNDLKTYEEKIDSFLILLNDKENQLEDLRKFNDEIKTKFFSEKSKKEENEEIYKFNLSKINSQHREDIKNMQIQIDNLKKELNSYKEEEIRKDKEVKVLIESECKKFKEDSQALLTQLKMKELQENDFIVKEEKLKREIEEVNIKNARTYNENLSMIKEKIHLENKLKIYETNESETKSNNYVLGERNKYMLKEIEDLKLDISSKSYKIDNLTKLLEDSSSELSSLKQRLQLREFEIEKKAMNERSLSERAREAQFLLEKLTEEKRQFVKDSEEERQQKQNLEYKNKILSEDIFRLTNIREKLEEENKRNAESIEAMSKKIKELRNIEHNTLPQPQSDPVANNKDSLLDFFSSNSLNLKKENPLINILKEKESEIERLTKELDGAKGILTKAEYDMQDAFQVFKDRENELLERIKELEVESIRTQIECKNALNSSNTRELNELRDLKEAKEKYQFVTESKNREIDAMKNQINSKIKECAKYKKERDRLADICCDLRAKINRIDNINIYNNEISGRFSNDEDNKSTIDQNGIIEERDYEEIRRMKDKILNRSSQDKEDVHSTQIKNEAKRHIENAMNKMKSKSNGKYEIRNHTESPNLRKVQIDYTSRYSSRSKSNSKSKSPDPHPEHAMKITKYNLNTDPVNDNHSIHNLKLLKRTRMKSEGK